MKKLLYIVMSCVVLFCSCQKEEEDLDIVNLGGPVPGYTQISFIVISGGYNLFKNEVKPMIDLSKSQLWEIYDGKEVLHKDCFTLNDDCALVTLYDRNPEKTELNYLIKWNDQITDTVRCETGYVDYYSVAHMKDYSLTKVFVNGNLEWSLYDGGYGNEKRRIYLFH